MMDCHLQLDDDGFHEAALCGVVFSGARADGVAGTEWSWVRWKPVHTPFDQSVCLF